MIVQSLRPNVFIDGTSIVGPETAELWLRRHLLRMRIVDDESLLASLFLTSCTALRLYRTSMEIRDATKNAASKTGLRVFRPCFFS